jgi:hypothetical protein
MKFSIFGKTFGTNYSNAKLGLTNQVDSLGFRMRYAIIGVSGSSLDVKFNGGTKDLDAVAKSYEHIKDFTLSTPETGDITVCCLVNLLPTNAQHIN